MLDSQMDKKQTKKRQKKDPSYDGDLSPCKVGIQLDKAFLS